ncbi:uncharacterized protein [Bos mutus]|uniref:uncharacterized protein n=1 Tax=Bos mutus TaxID=72004 RepID=UPI0038B6229B
MSRHRRPAARGGAAGSPLPLGPSGARRRPAEGRSHAAADCWSRRAPRPATACPSRRAPRPAAPAARCILGWPLGLTGWLTAAHARCVVPRLRPRGGSAGVRWPCGCRGLRRVAWHLPPGPLGTGPAGERGASAAGPIRLSPLLGLGPVRAVARHTKNPGFRAASLRSSQGTTWRGPAPAAVCACSPRCGSVELLIKAGAPVFSSCWNGSLPRRLPQHSALTVKRK